MKLREIKKLYFNSCVIKIMIAFKNDMRIIDIRININKCTYLTFSNIIQDRIYRNRALLVDSY